MRTFSSYMPSDRRPSQQERTKCRGEQIDSHSRADVNQPCSMLLGEFAGKPHDFQPSSKQRCLKNIGTLTSSDAVQKKPGS
nr:hypothetical protein FVER53263_20536 [Fusarium verticillioides]